MISSPATTHAQKSPAAIRRTSRVQGVCGQNEMEMSPNEEKRDTEIDVNVSVEIDSLDGL